MIGPLLSELSRAGRAGHELAPSDVPSDSLPEALRREALTIPEVGELDAVRHFTRLSQRNYAIDLGFYPLGSCTMKYNPKINELVARLPGFAALHPYQSESTLQGALHLLYDLQQILAEITGFSAATLQPAAGAHGELCGLLMVRAYHEKRGDSRRRVVLIPDSAHGTNPATAAMCGYSTVSIRTDARGNVDLRHLREHLDDRVAAMMLTNPNTLGLFEENVIELAAAVHEAGGLMYGDGANLNAILGAVKPAEVGFDVFHINTHKTFSTPHGGGGPGSGPVVVGEALEPFLPTPRVVLREDGQYGMDFDRPDSIGRMREFVGHFGVLVRAYTYIRMHGAEGLRQISDVAVLNANYLRVLLQDLYDLPYQRTCMHEFVLSGRRQKQLGVRTLDIAKRLIDYGFYPPTVYFPLIVDEAIMIEPTESETRDTLNSFVEAMTAIAREAEENPDLVHQAPTSQDIGRLDEVRAARQPVLRWTTTPATGG